LERRKLLSKSNPKNIKNMKLVKIGLALAFLVRAASAQEEVTEEDDDTASQFCVYRSVESGTTLKYYTPAGEGAMCELEKRSRPISSYLVRDEVEDEEVEIYFYADSSGKWFEFGMDTSGDYNTADTSTFKYRQYHAYWGGRKGTTVRESDGFSYWDEEAGIKGNGSHSLVGALGGIRLADGSVLELPLGLKGLGCSWEYNADSEGTELQCRTYNRSLTLNKTLTLSCNTDTSKADTTTGRIYEPGTLGLAVFVVCEHLQKAGYKLLVTETEEELEEGADGL
jgi:hypothetical protein